jgi:His-Xaa-Ser system radical SAM maturase HxsC
MLKLSGRAEPAGLMRPATDDVWRVCLPDVNDPGESLACLLPAGEQSVDGYGLYLAHESGPLAAPGPVIRLGQDLSHIEAGDIIHVPADGRRVTVLWKNSAAHNGLLLTERCDNYCLMCSQPPKDRDDSWLFDRARKVISLLPPAARALSLTGGEPTLHAEALLGLLTHIRRTRPDLSVHLLSNGRRFDDLDFARAYAAVGLADLMVGIPVYAPEPGLHDFVVQSLGAFEETIHGILNLANLCQPTELRVVVQRHTVPVLADLATFIVRNLPFVAQVALMGLEMTGLARPNAADVWIDPADYQSELAEAVRILATAGVRTRIYNHQLCVLDRGLWPYAVRSISDWKNTYLDLCRDCAVREHCGGVFATSGPRLSKHLHALPQLRPSAFLKNDKFKLPRSGMGGCFAPTRR